MSPRLQQSCRHRVKEQLPQAALKRNYVILAAAMDQRVSRRWSEHELPKLAKRAGLSEVQARTAMRKLHRGMFVEKNGGEYRLLPGWKRTVRNIVYGKHKRH